MRGEKEGPGGGGRLGRGDRRSGGEGGRAGRTAPSRSPWGRSCASDPLLPPSSDDYPIFFLRLRVESPVEEAKKGGTRCLRFLVRREAKEEAV